MSDPPAVRRRNGQTREFVAFIVERDERENSRVTLAVAVGQLDAANQDRGRECVGGFGIACDDARAENADEPASPVRGSMTCP